ncbi:penicillin-binding protein A [Pilimelia anulata]|uniref:Penicillin-binding protein A n=1 Tax=Pilimelia anulata TaxID=53371 RepID=A0A8J3B9W6_9ACTN|nr:penicillin-binding protein 2 [Pilimelia anulata]GGJ88663.1 penicillin-binding protein A [Pilimelia anulata]
MNAPLRKVGVVVLILFGLLFGNLNWVQAYKADEYRESEYNSRGKLEEYLRQRGAVEAQGKALAVSVATDGRFRYLRKYPFGPQYAHVVGYKPLDLASIAIERSENAFLAGSSDRLLGDRIKEMLTGKKTGGGNVLLSLSQRAQQAAFTELTRNQVDASRGAAIALDPRTGAVQALVSLPSYDPNPLVVHNTKTALAAYNKLLADSDKPLNNRATAETLPPGSTFKVIVAAAALENGYEPGTAIPAGPSYRPPGTTQEIRNAVPSICPESQVTLIEALTESCNTGFAQLGVKLGAERLKSEARAFGFGDAELTVGRLDDGGIGTAPSETGEMRNPNGQDDPAAVAQSSIGQRDVRMTPLEGALIAGAIANDGKQMRPYVVRQLLGPDRSTLYNASPAKLREPVNSAVAADLRQMMVSVVRNGTGTNARISGYEVGGKTGTAQNGDAPDHGWFIGFVRDSGGTPISAVAVVLENAGQGGSGEATRIAGRIMRAVVEDPRRGG